MSGVEMVEEETNDATIAPFALRRKRGTRPDRHRRPHARPRLALRRDLGRLPPRSAATRAETRGARAAGATATDASHLPPASPHTPDACPASPSTALLIWRPANPWRPRVGALPLTAPHATVHRHVRLLRLHVRRLASHPARRLVVVKQNVPPVRAMRSWKLRAVNR